MLKKIVVTVEDLKGKCRFWKVGDKIVLWRGEGSRLLGIDYKLSDGRGACLAGLMSLYPFLLGPIETWDGKTACNRFRESQMRLSSEHDYRCWIAKFEDLLSTRNNLCQETRKWVEDHLFQLNVDLKHLRAYGTPEPWPQKLPPQ